MVRAMCLNRMLEGVMMKEDAWTIVTLVGSIIAARVLGMDYGTGLMLVVGCTLVGMGLDVTIMHIELSSIRWTENPRMQEFQSREIVEEFRNWPKPQKGDEPGLKLFSPDESMPS